MDASGVWAFYYLQGEDGEDRSHPNAFKIPSSGSDITLADVHRHFPLKDAKAFHYRFRLNAKNGGSNTFFWLDVTAPTQKIPLINGRIICKLLRLERPTKRVGVIMKRKPVLQWSHDKTARQGSGNFNTEKQTTSVTPLARQPSAANTNARPAKYSDAPPKNAPATSSEPRTASPAASENTSASSSRSQPQQSQAPPLEKAAAQQSTETFEDFLSGGGSSSSTTTSKKDVNLMDGGGWNDSAPAAKPANAASNFMNAMDPLAQGNSQAAKRPQQQQPKQPTEQPKFEDDGGQTVGPVTMAEMQKHCKSTSDGSNVYNPNLVDKSTKPEHVRRAMEERERQVQMDVEKAREELRQREEAARMMNTQKEQASAMLGPKLKAWAEDNGRVKNIRTLLSTMHQVMWEDSKWQEVNMGKLIQPNEVKKHYRKAMIVVHPDKSGGRNAEQLLIAERVFAAVNTAWEEFIKTNPC